MSKSDQYAVLRDRPPFGQPQLTYGSRTYPVGYTYDAQGRMKTMTNWSSFSTGAGARVTTWNYDAYRGFLASKTYDGNTLGPAYTYTAAGRLATRLWARGTNTTYGYTAAGDLASVSYNDGATPTITYSYDRRGRQITVANGTTTCNLTLNDAGQTLSEAYTNGPLDRITVTNGYDTVLRRTNVVTLASGSVLTMVTNNFDAAGRLSSVSDKTNSAAYGYLANSPLVSQITFKQSGSTRMTTTKTWDYLNRLSSIGSSNATPALVDWHGYAYNAANQRTSHTNTDGSFWLYGYDTLGQVISGKKYWSDGTPVAGEQFQYGFDDIGNRVSTAAGGDQWGMNLRYASYAANNLNQYTSRTVPGAADVTGSATNTATVTVNNNPTYRKGNYYRAQLGLPNSAAPVWQRATNLAVLNNGSNQDIVTNANGNVYLPQTPENFTYDADGNLTQDGRWQYSWDGENRLISMQAISAVPTAAKYKLDFIYDWQSRRVQKTISTNNGSTYYPLSTNRFAYDGWNLLAVLKPASLVAQAFVWGLDLGGTVKGAGGVGGLLVVGDASLGSHFVAFDGNGNVSALAKASDGAISAQYEYTAFGEVLRASGPAANTNLFRFSSKYQDGEGDLIDYGRRYCNPGTGRWLSPDPMRERGGPNAYLFVGNNAMTAFDPDGQITVRTLTDNPATTCGSAAVSFNFILDQPAPQEGYIVQENVADIPWDNYDCDGIKEGNIWHDHYWEAWPIHVNKRFATDDVGWPGEPNVIGAGGIQGTIKFFYKTRTGDLGDPFANPPTGPDASTGWTWKTSSPSSLSLPSTRIQPTWWNDPPDNGESAAERSVYVAWDCCCSSRISSIAVTPGPVLGRSSGAQ